MQTRFNYPTRIIFGQGVIEKVCDELKALGGKRPLIVTDSGLVKTGLPDRLRGILENGGLPTLIFSGVSPNPTDAQADDGAAAYKAHRADSIVAIGGGSALDAGKAVQVRINNHEPMEVYDDNIGGDAKITGALPQLIAIPTTSGTGSEVGRSAVITVAAVHRKVVVFHPKLLPAVALCDPELTYGLPPRITAETGMDALSHSLEAYVAKGYHPMADAIALKGIRMVADNLVKAVENGKDVIARQEMMMASTMGATAFQKGLGVIHSLAHPLSSTAGVSHGLANAIMMPFAIRFNASAAAERAADVAVALRASEASAEGAARAVEALLKKLGLPTRLSAAGVTLKHIEQMIPKAMEDGCHPSNPRACTAADMEALYKAAL